MIIKARAWNPAFGEMVYSTGGTEFAKREFYPVVMDVGFSHYPEDGWIIMLSTELKDKQGKDIFKSDIIDASYINPMSDEIIKRHYLVDYDRGCFIARLIGKSPAGDTPLYFQASKGKVIGNQYEHPELLCDTPT